MSTHQPGRIQKSALRISVVQVDSDLNGRACSVSTTRCVRTGIYPLPKGGTEYMRNMATYAAQPVT